MRMFRTGIYFELCHHLTTERITRNHALNRLLNHAFRKTTAQDFTGCGIFNAADITGMLIIVFVSELFAGQFNFVGIDNNDIVAAIQVRGEIRLILAAQNLGDFSGKTT